MNKLNRAIFDDFILCFFGREEDLESLFWRKYFLEGEGRIVGYKEAFPENEVCEDLVEVLVKDSCGCCSHYEYRYCNYINR